MKRRVVITGIGINTALGNEKKEFFNNLMNKKYRINKIPDEFEKNYKFKSRYYVPAPEISIEDIGLEKRYNLLISNSSKLSIISTYNALLDAGFDVLNKDKKFAVKELDNCNVVMGLGMPDLQTAFDSYISNVQENEQKNVRYNRMVIPITMPNSVSAWISILFGINGANSTINASCSSGSYAIGQGYRSIKNGICNMVIAGGVDFLKSKNGSIMRGFDILGTLTKSVDGLPKPFSDERSGFLFNEGASAVLILEELETARKRNANIYAEIVDFTSNSDAYNIVEMNPDGKMIESLFENIKGIDIDYFNAHGTGTILNDNIERNMILKVFGKKEKQPVINSTKGIVGHSIGASGAIEAAVTVLSIKESMIHGNLIDKGFDDLNLNIHSVEKQINYAISTQYGFGGHNALILFKAF